MKKRSEKTTLASTEESINIPAGHETTSLIKDIRSLIESARSRAATAINTEMVMLYGHIGERIKRDIHGNERADYGKMIVQMLSEKLTTEYGRGFTRTNLFNIIRFAEVFNNLKIVQTLSEQLSWSHFVQIIAPRVMPQEGVSTYALLSIGVRRVEKPQGFSIDKRRYIPVTGFGAQSNGSIYREKSKAKVVFQPGLTGSTGYVLSFNQVHHVFMEAKFR